MQILIAILVYLVVMACIWRLETVYDRTLMLFEYGTRVRRCPACGKRCFSVRRRAALDQPWGEWRSECCDAQMEEAL